MTPSDEIYNLIKSLTAHEKRYFKVWASNHVIGKSNHYEKLFDALDALPHDQPYDENAFKKSLRGKSYGKNLSDEKSNLREIILKAMRVYHADKSPESKLLEMVHEIRFLYNRGLMKSCIALIEKAVKLAEETEQYSMMLIINDYLMGLFNMDKLDRNYTAQSIEDSERDVIEKINLSREAVYLRIRIADINATHQWVQKSKEAEQIMQQATEMSKLNNLTAKAELSLLNTQQFYLIRHKKYEECLKITTEWRDKYEKLENPYLYLNESYRPILANYMQCAMMIERFDLLPPAIEKIKNIKTTDEREAALSFRLVTQYELIYLLNTAHFSGADKMLGEIEAGLEKYARFIPESQVVPFRFNISLLHFLQKNFTDSLTQIQQFYFYCGRSERYVHLTAIARTMEWMCQCSLKNHNILDSSLRNLKRYYSERDMKNDFLDAMFNSFSTIIKEAGLNPTSISDAKRKLSQIVAPPEWEQLKAIVLEWS